MCIRKEHWIKELREEKDISQRMLYEGLCAQSLSSKIEQGEKDIDQLLIYALLGRDRKSVV